MNQAQLNGLTNFIGLFGGGEGAKASFLVNGEPGNP